MSAQIADVGAADFDREVLEKSRTTPVVVDFWASWCGPCQVLGPILEQAVARTDGKVILVKVDADREPDLCATYGVQSIPTVKAFRGGRVVAEFVGAQPAQVVEAWLAGLIPSASEQVLAAAQRALAADRPSEAEDVLRRHLAAHDADGAALLQLARLVAARGAHDEALSLLDRVPDAAPEAEEAARDRRLLDLLAAGAKAPDLATARARVASAPGDMEARFTLAGAAWLAGDPQRALGELLEIVRRDRSFRDDGARRALLALLERMGHDHPAVGPTLNELGMILFK